MEKHWGLQTHPKTRGLLLTFAHLFAAGACLSGHPGVLGCCGVALSPNGMIWRKGESVAVRSTLGFNADGITSKDASARAHGKINEKQEFLALVYIYIYILYISEVGRGSPTVKSFRFVRRAVR